MKECETYVACGADICGLYSSNEDKDKAAWEYVAKIIEILGDTGYNIVIRKETTGIVVVEYNNADMELGYHQPMWVSEDEKFAILDMRETQHQNSEGDEYINV